MLMATKQLFLEFYDRARNLERDIDQIREAAAEAVQQVRGDLKQLFSEAKTCGVDTAALKAVLKAKELERRQELIRASLDAVSQDNFDQMVLDLEGPPK